MAPLARVGWNQCMACAFATAGDIPIVSIDMQFIVRIANGSK
jgi:hypothetical protein